MKENNLELLCPAGNVDSFRAACQNGADAIYMGASKFNARVMAKNFTVDEYIDCIKYAHMRNIKVFLTLKFPVILPSSPIITINLGFNLSHNLNCGFMFVFL